MHHTPLYSMARNSSKIIGVGDILTRDALPVIAMAAYGRPRLLYHQPSCRQQPSASASILALENALQQRR